MKYKVIIKPLLVSFVIVIATFVSFAQPSKVDSLLSEYSQPNLERLDALIKIIPHIKDSLRLVKLGTEGINLAQKLQDPNREAQVLRTISTNYGRNLNDLKTAVEYLNAAISLADKLSDFDKVRTFAERGSIYMGPLRQPQKGLEDLLKAKEINEKLPDAEKYGWLYIQLGQISWMDGNMEESREHFLEALRIDRLQEENLSIALTALGNVEYALGNYSSALNYFLEALNIIENTDLRNIDVVLANISTIYISKGHFEKALEINKKELGYALESNNPYRICLAYRMVGMSYLNNKQFPEAKNAFYTGLKIAKKEQLHISEFDLNRSLATFYSDRQPQPDSIFYYLNANEKLKNKYNIDDQDNYEKNYSFGVAYTEIGEFDKAEKHLKEALEFAYAQNDIFVKAYCQRALYNFYDKKNNAQLALKHYKEYNMLNDSMRSNTQNLQIADMQTKYETEKKEAENKNLLAQNNFISKQSQQYKMGAGILAILLTFLGYFLFQLRRTRNLLSKQNQQLQQLNATKDKFFGIIAHDIRSPIVALDGVGEQMDYYLEKNNKDKLQRLAGRVDSTAKKLSSLLDNLLNWALLQQGVIPYHPKALNVKEVAQGIFEMFQNNAEAKDVTLKLQIDDKQKVYADESALNTILRNLVSNAIKFTSEGGTVTLSTESKGDKVFIHINDTGTGISAEKLSKLFSFEKKSEKGTVGEKGTGLGLTLVKELAELNKGSIDVNSVLKKGTTFKLSLPSRA